MNNVPSSNLVNQAAQHQPIRYLVIAACSALSFNAVLIGVHWAGAHYLAALVAAFSVVVVGAYCAHAAFTFEVEFSGRGFARFLGTQLLGFPISLAILAGLIDGLGLPVWIATPIATILLFFYNFISARWAILLGSKTLG